MLSFEEKQTIIESFSELTKKQVSLGRLNYHYDASVYDKTVIVQHLHPNGNGFVYVAGIPGYAPDSRGLVNIREATEAELRQTIADAIAALSKEILPITPVEQVWVDGSGAQLQLHEEGGFWNVYHGDHLEDGFGDYEEAAQYLTEEGFRLVKGKENGR